MDNNPDRMDQAAVRKKPPIGCGITEAACKNIVKAGLCGGGMRWHLRCSSNCWDRFRQRLDQ